MKKILLSASFVALSSVAFAENSISARYITIDGTLSIGGFSVTGDGAGYSLTGTFDIGDTDFLALGSVESVSGTGTISGTAWSFDSTVIGVGYKIIDELDEDSGLQLISGLGYISSAGDFTFGGTKYFMDADATVLLGQAQVKAGESLAITSEVGLALEGDSDPTFALGLSYDVTETGSIDLGYSANTTVSEVVTLEVTSWTLGYSYNF